MKMLLAVLTLLVASTAIAQPPPGMSDGDMQGMQQQMQKMQECMKDADQTELQKVEKRSVAFRKEISALCSAGKRSAAQEKNMSFAKEIAEIPAMKIVQKCTMMMVSEMQNTTSSDSINEFDDIHVCDEQ